MYRFFNPNPQGLLVGDCTIRALCAVTGLSWGEIHDELCDLSKEMADMPSADRVWRELLKQYGFHKRKFLSNTPYDYTVADFAADNPDGIFILCPAEHVVAVINGNWWDSWDSGMKIPDYYFKR